MTNKIKTHLSKDPILKKVIESRTLKPRVRGRNLYEALIRSIVGQQLSVKAAATIHERFLALFDESHPSPQQIIDADHEHLRSCGLSNSKAKYVKNVATYFNGKDTSALEAMPDQELIDELTQIKGVGTWTVEMILMFALHREDVFPIGDLGVRKAMIELYDVNIEDKKKRYSKLTEIAEQWRPYRSYGSRLMWEWLDTTGI